MSSLSFLHYLSTSEDVPTVWYHSCAHTASRLCSLGKMSNRQLGHNKGSAGPRGAQIGAQALVLEDEA